MSNHLLYSNQDTGIPPQIQDRNGDVVLAMCKICHKVEKELDAPCRSSAVLEYEKLLFKIARQIYVANVDFFFGTEAYEHKRQSRLALWPETINSRETYTTRKIYIDKNIVLAAMLLKNYNITEKNDQK